MAFWHGISVEVLAVDYLDFRDLEKVNERALTSRLESAQQTVERYCRRQFTPQPALTSEGADTNPPVQRRINAFRSSMPIRIPDLRWAVGESLVSLDGLALDKGVSYDIEPDVDYEPATYITLDRQSESTGSGALLITGRWGWNPIPEDLYDAVYMLAARRYRERQANYADQVVTPEGVSFAYLRQLPATVQQTLNELRVPNFAFV